MKVRVFIVMGFLLACSGFSAEAAETVDIGDMIKIPGGTFTMGRDDGPADEKPAHAVSIKMFLLDKTPVTNRRFAVFLNATGGKTNEKNYRLYDHDDDDARIHRVNDTFRADAGFEEHPVVEASWFGARNYCKWAGKRLPTEAEWEFAARGKEGRTYPWGNDEPDATRARYGAGWGMTIPVGSLPRGATPEGVLDMAGNTHEWVGSLYWKYPYRANDGRENPDSMAPRGTRGGGHDDSPNFLRSTYRGEFVSRNPRAGHRNIGFRCAKSLP
ncbi:MAG: SUMF1/EgtB/PvdO family nonheme iron enzyme [Rhodospirillales bacterium]